MSQLSEVEVQSSSGAWLGGAHIVDYRPEVQTVMVSFYNDPNRCDECSISTIRFISSDTGAATKKFSVGDCVEIRVDLHDQTEIPQWFPGMIINFKGDFYVCEYNNCGQIAKDVFELSALRYPNNNKCLTSDNIHRTEVEIPDDLINYCESHKDEHIEFRKSCGAMSVRYNNGKLVVLSRTDVSGRVEMLKEFHVTNLQQKMKLAERVSDLTEALQQSKMVAESNCERFAVDRQLLKYVVGARGVNINNARSIPGIIHIGIDDKTNIVSIYAETAEAATEARQLLEYTEEHYFVPKKLVGRIIGQKGKSIQDVIDRSHVYKMTILSADDAKNIDGADDPSITVFKILGTRSNNANAKALMDYLIHSLKEIKSLQDETLLIEDQIKTYRVGGNVTYNCTNGNGQGDYNNDAALKKKTRIDVCEAKVPEISLMVASVERNPI